MDYFNEQKARELTSILLKNDISIYRKLLPEVQKMNSEDFQSLFEGIDDQEFNVKNKKDFKKLSIKFNNFHVILEEWYQKPKYYAYLKELWTRYPCIENLRCKEDDEFEKAMKSFSINYDKWPTDVKSEFKTLVNNTEDTTVYELKQIIEDKFSELNSVLEELIVFKKAIKEQEENLVYEKNSQSLILNIIETIALPLAYMFGQKNIAAKEAKVANKIIYNKCFNKKQADFITKDFIKIIEKKKCTGCYNYIDKNKKIYKLKLQCKNGKLNNLKLGQKAKAFFKSKVVCGLHAALSFLNLGWSIYELTQTYKGFQQVKNYKKRLEEIVALFNVHKKEIGILPEDFSEAAIRIRNVLDKIRKDQQDLRNLINDIRKSIQFQESQKNKAIAGIVGSIGLGIFGVVGGIVTANGTSVIYGVSSVANAASAIAHTTNLVMSSKLIKEFNDVLAKAYEEEEKIQKEIDNLINELTNRLEQQPKFDLNASISSISTEIEDNFFEN